MISILKAIGSLVYFATGYALSFGGGNAFCGTDYFGLIGLPDDQLAMCFFQYTFAATAATIPSGVVHERCTLTAYLCYTTLIAGPFFF
jgi:Amt family ammonium transporter